MLGSLFVGRRFDWCYVIKSVVVQGIGIQVVVILKTLLAISSQAIGTRKAKSVFVVLMEKNDNDYLIQMFAVVMEDTYFIMR
ncbi:MAG: hypothetical protein CMJ82_13065 [Planctomycetaceae bacterium]|nr:hypothetical protein [Planctomycetaceae bacterium]